MKDCAPTSSRLRLYLAVVVAVWVGQVCAATAGPPGVRTAPEALVAATQEDEAKSMIPDAWLGETVTVEQAEAENPGITDDRVRRFPEAARPFAFQNPEWEALKAKMRAGDVLRSFGSPPESWQHLAGRAGIALCRDGKVIDTMVTIMN